MEGVTDVRTITRHAVYIESNTEARSCNQFCGGKAMSFTYSECVFVELGTQHAQRTRHRVLSSVACPALQYFSTSHNRQDFKKKKKLLTIKHAL
jgi:hypothetical protein